MAIRHERICKYCNEVFFTTTNRINISKDKYCSPECSQKSQRNRIKVSCLNCNKDVLKTPTDIKKNKTGQFFCSHSCSNEHRSKSKKEDRICEICNEVFNVIKSSKKRFCTMGCQSKWQSKYLIGENANNYKKSFSIEDRTVNCEWCNDAFQISSPHKLLTNKKNLCSRECYREWYAKDWSQQEEWKQESRERAVRMLEEGSFGHTDTSCQVKVNNILNDLDINFVNEYNCKYVSIDNFLTDFNLMIEVMGTYWHTDPRIYEKIKYKPQLDRVINDKRKKSIIKNNHNVNILYLWEKDIEENPLLIEALIKLYTMSKGSVLNYHSFNYSLDGSSIELNGNLISPYFDYDIGEINEITEISHEKISKKQQEKWIAFNCDNCNQQTEQLISRYIKATNHFCSYECVYTFKK